MLDLKKYTLVLILAALLPAGLTAQKYESDKVTKEADKFIGLAMTRSDLAARKQQYLKALAVLEPALPATDNAKVWYTAGIVYVGLEQYADADNAFKKALAMSPKAAEDIETERSAGWLQAFTAGAALIDKEQLDEALVLLEGAEALYAKRPEAALNIASIYAAKGNHEKAEQAFRQAAERAQGELYATQDTAVQRTWRSYVELSTLNIAQLRAARGNDAFNANKFDEAAAAYQSAREINPYSRDYVMNYVQARYSKVIAHEDAIKADTTKLAALKPELLKLYAEIKAEVPKVRAFDPTNVNMELILSDVVRHEGELSGNGDAARKVAYDIAQKADSMPLEVIDLSIQRAEDAVTVAGKVRNKTLAPGKPVTVKITLIGSKGQTVGEVTATVAAGAKDSATPFEQKAAVSGLVAGWKYTVTM